MGQRIDRLKIVLATKHRKHKWLSVQLVCMYSTVSKWCTNTNQLDLITMTKIANLLDVYICQLSVSSKYK